ncbi:hypothetical protein B0H17DRAFT_1327334 [Mycena rosella]|uniref:Uncharacterized protein n=1 Tax=Mycena rosella TaxID=1033263 RepID=A0AAD7GN41_MYCRO|nr:hypothetical protein B0H17DRAFT_1327334 [Mycena rosella]
MWTKLSHALKSKQAQDGGHEQPAEPLAGPSTSPSKSTLGRKVFHRDDGSLRLNSPLKLPSIQKVKSTFNLNGNGSQLTLTPDTLLEPAKDLSRRASKDDLSASRPKATRRSSFNILITRRPSIDALRSPPETPRSVSPNSSHTRNRAATFGGSVRSILREPNTPTAAPATGKSVRFFGNDVPTPGQSLEHLPVISRSTPPEETFLQHLQRSDSGTSYASSAMPRFASRYRRPSVAEVFSPLGSSTDSPHPEQAPQLANFFEQLGVPAIPSLNAGLHVPNSDLPDALSSTPLRDVSNGGRETGSKESLAQAADISLRGQDKPPRLPSISHDRSTSFSFGQTVFYSMDHSDSKRPSSAKSSLISNADSSITSASSSTSSTSSSPSIGRHRSLSDGVLRSMMRGSSAQVAEETSSASSFSFIDKCDPVVSQPDPFSANANTYYTPQTMIPTTPPQNTPRHVRRASKEESIIFSLKTQLDLQNELCGQFEADLRARDELVEVLGTRLAEAEEEDAKKRKFLRAWKKRVSELERTCRFLEDEVEGSRQDSMERSVMDEASSEALQMLHRQISGLEREREGLRRTEAVLREEVGRLERLAGESRSEAASLRESLSSRSESEKEGKQKGDEQAAEVEEEKRRHAELEMAWQAEKEDMIFAMDNIKLNNIGLVADLDDFKHQLRARDDEIAALKAEVSGANSRAERASGLLAVAEAGKCALAMERDSLKLQVVKLQEKTAKCNDAERKVFELEDDLQGLWDIRESLEKEREQLQAQIREEEGRVEAFTLKLKASEKERQSALDKVSRLEDDIRRRDIKAAEDSQRAADVEELREQMGRMRREALGAEASKQMEIDAQAKTLLEFKVEIERLKGQNRELQQDSADKEVQIVQTTKERVQDKQDLAGLNIALDSKQQELELLKRRLGVRGTAGNTPAQTAHQRRDSVVSITSRTSRLSFTSEAGADSSRERKASGESCTKIPAPSKNRRLSSSTSVLPTPPKPTRGSMGPPPPLRARSSIVGSGTPTTTPRTLTRSSSSSLACTTAGVKAKVSKPATPNPNSASSHSVTQGEKENANVSGSRRLSRIPTLA